VKTISLKKVSAVAVASLGFGLLSVVPVNAAQNAADVNAISLAKVTTTPATGSAVAVNFLATTDAITNAVTADSTYRFIGYVSSAPAGGSVSGSWSTTAPTTDTEIYVAATGTTPVVTEGGGGTATYTVALDGTTGDEDYTGNASTVATSAVGAAQFSFTPAKVGTYVVTVFNDADNSGVQGVTEIGQTISLTVVAPSGYSNSLSTGFISYGAAGTAPTSTTTAGQNSVTAAKGGADATNDNAAAIDLVIKDTTNTAYASASVSAEISGPGYIRWVDETVDADNCTTTPTYGADLGRSLAARAVDAQSALYVCADGTSGVATVTVKVTDVDDSVQTLVTRTVTFFGAVKTIAATGVLTIARSGGATLGDPTANRTTAAETPAIIVKATDASGTGVSGLNFTYKSSSTAVMTETLTCAEDVKATANVFSSGGNGFYNCRVTSSTGSKSGDKATLTVRTVDPAGDGTTFLTSDVAFTIGGSAATGTETLSFDKTSYAPGEAMIVTRTAKDSAGNTVSDFTASPALTFTKAVGGTAPVAGVYVGGKSASSTSAATATVFAPVTPGSFTVTATAANGATISATATVTDANAGLLTQIDALNAKIVALNALIAKIMKKLGVK